MDENTTNMNQTIESNEQPQNNPNVKAAPKMKWHKFLINFALFAGALFCFAYGIAYASGVIYQIQDSTISFVDIGNFYLKYAGMQVLNIVFGTFMILFAFFVVLVRFQLARFKQGAPQKLNIVCFGIVAVQVVYLMFKTFILDELMNPVVIAPGIIMAIINIIYYKKRKPMFVH